MDLGEEDLPGRPVLGPPLLDPSLQRPQLAVGEATGILPLQILEQGLGLEGLCTLIRQSDVHARTYVD